MPRRVLVPLLFLIWTIPGLISGLLTAAFFPRSVLSVRPWLFFAIQILVWWIWIPFTPIITAATRRFPLEAGRLRRALPVHAALAIAAIATYTAMYALTGGLLRSASEPRVTFIQFMRSLVSSRAPIGILVYAAVVGVTIAVDERARRRQRELQAARLEAELMRAQLQALQMQLQPHFLFNTLHAISILVQESPADASRMISKLGDLLRQTLALVDIPQVTLREELDILGRYLEIEAIRFGDRLTVTVDVSGDVLALRVPTFVLQPIVENAVRHGVGPRVDPGRVVVRGRRAGNRVVIAVEDDGPGFAFGTRGDTGVGLASTRQRLAVLYGDLAQLRCENSASGGACVTIELPVVDG